MVTDDDVTRAVAALIEGERLGALLTAVAGTAVGSKAVLDYGTGVVAGGLSVSNDLLADARQLMDREQNRVLAYDGDEIFVETLAPPPRLLIFGAVHIAQALCDLATRLGFRVEVSDSRPAFVTEDRFPSAVDLLVGWPDELGDRISIDRRTYVVLLSHDARFEGPVLPMVLASDAKYIGAMGSRRTHRQRVERLAADGYSDEAIARIHGPVGIDIGAETPEETAVSILAEMIQVRYGSGDGLSLTGREGRIHLHRIDDEGDI